MTSKDYIKLADALRRARPYGDSRAYQGWSNAAFQITEALRVDNPMFDTYKFQAACGLRDNQENEA